MTHGQARARTVLVRLRSMMSHILRHPVVCRLLVVGGIAVAGWLAGTAVSAGQAHAGTAPGPATGITRPVLDTGHDKAVERTANRPAPAAKDRGDVLRGVVTSKRGDGILGLPVKVKGFVTGLLPAVDRIGTDAPWAPRHSPNAGAVGGGRTDAHSPIRLAASGAPKDVPGAYAQGGADAVNPAPVPGFPHPASGEIAVLPSAGFVSVGGAMGYPIRRLEALSHPAPVLPIPPAVHTATDEPALSPD